VKLAKDLVIDVYNIKELMDKNQTEKIYYLIYNKN
jgi:hypothetical protein